MKSLDLLIRAGVVCCLVPVALSADDFSDVDARVTQIEGTVYVHLKDLPEGKFVPAESGFPLEPGDHLRTGTDGSVELGIGGESIIYIGSNSDFIVNALQQEHREFFLGIGHLVAKIKSLMSDQTMEIHTPVFVAAVRGTEFAIAQELDEEPGHVGVFDEGHLSVSSNEKEGAVLLGPGEETSVDQNAVPARPTQIRFLEKYRSHMERVRQRVTVLPHEWTKIEKSQFKGKRDYLLSKKTLKGEELKNVNENHRRRSYEHIHQQKHQLNRRPIEHFREHRRNHAR